MGKQQSVQPSDISLIEQLPGQIAWKDNKRQYLGANRALLNHFELSSPAELIGKKDSDITPNSNDENQLFKQQDLHVLNGKIISTLHTDKKTHELFILEKRPLLDEKKNIAELIYHCLPYPTKNPDSNTFNLSTRETQCVELIIKGKSAKEIAAFLSISKRTVESYVENIKNKMNCKNKAEIITKAMLYNYHRINTVIHTSKT